MSNEHMMQIEIKGVKMEIDTRYATRIEELRIGTHVKVLKKEYSSHSVFPGVIIGFEPFKELPTLVIAYLSKRSYSSEPDLKFLHYNAKTEDIEVIAAADEDFAEFRQTEINESFDNMIETKKNELEELKRKKKFFNEKFQSYWRPVEPVLEPEAKDEA